MGEELKSKFDRRRLKTVDSTAGIYQREQKSFRKLFSDSDDSNVDVSMGKKNI